MATYRAVSVEDAARVCGAKAKVRHSGGKRRGRDRDGRLAAAIEALEVRCLLAAVTVDAGTVVAPIDGYPLGTNITWWQWELTTPRMEQMIEDAGLTLLRLPGGSSSNSQHFADPAPYGGYNTAAKIAQVIENVGADGMVTLNYGTGSPQEGAAYLAYFNAQVGDTTVIGHGSQWSDANGWVDKDWQTAGYWASLRAAAPLAVDDGLNFLRANHSSPWGFTYYEVGNEDYATWENDRHGQGGDTGAPQDPATYVGFSKTFSDLAHQIDPNVKVGLDVTLPMQWNLPDQQWTEHVLQQCASVGLTPGFLSDHVYIGLSDENLLLHSVNDPAFNDGWAPLNWQGRTDAYKAKLQAALGDAGQGVQIMLTEFNCDLGSKQSTSLVSGLFMADAIAGALKTGYSATLQWDLTNGYGNMADDPSHYGWRTGSDNGMISTGGGPAPASGAYIAYPAYFAEQLLSKMLHNGDELVSANSDDPYLTTYAVRGQDGKLELLVINKNSTTDLTGTFNIAGFAAGTHAQMWQYGKAEDTAQSLSSDGQSALTNLQITMNASADGLSYVFPSYSMTVIELNAVPTAALTHTDAVVPGASAVTFTVTYSDDAAISRATLGDDDILVTGPGGFSALAHLMGASEAGDAAQIVATYSVAAPGGSWDGADNGTYTIAMQSDAVSDSSGNKVAGGELGQFVVGVDSTAPSAVLTVEDVVYGRDTHQFVVTYTDETAVKWSTIDSADVRVTGPAGSGFDVAAELVAVEEDADAQTLRVTYAVPGPGGRWDEYDHATYTVWLTGGQVSDTAGNFAGAQELGSFECLVTVAPTGPLVVHGTNGDDTILASWADDVLTVTVNGEAQSYAGVTALTILGLRGNDTITLDDTAPIGATLSGGVGADTITGGAGADQIRGGVGNDVLIGGGGNDRLKGNMGNDLLAGGDGADRLMGDNGNDTLQGEEGDDVLLSGPGRDELTGGAGRDLLVGGSGKDTLFARDAEIDTVFGGGKRDTAQVDELLDQTDVRHLLK